MLMTSMILTCKVETMKLLCCHCSMSPCMLLLHEGRDYCIFGGRDRVELEVTEGENVL